MPTKSKYFLATGVKADVEHFLTTFSESDTVRYEEFSKLWREKNMSFIFCGRVNEMELREVFAINLTSSFDILKPKPSKNN